MNGNFYTASFSAVAVSAGQDLIALLADATSRIAICRIEIGQYSDAGDAAAELLPYVIQRGATTVGSGGTAATPVNVRAHGKSAVTTARVNDTTPAANGTIVTVLSGTWNVQAGLVYAPRYNEHFDERIMVAAGQRLVINLPTAPADALTMSGYVLFEELGTYGY
jgi:hypothetical protein